MEHQSSSSRADIAILWTLHEDTRCLLARVDRHFEVRVARTDAILRRVTFDDVAPALTQAARWRQEFSDCEMTYAATEDFDVSPER